MWILIAAFVLTAAVPAIADPVVLSNERFFPVENYNQLWRFQVGKDYESGFSVGEEYICLLSSHDRFVRVVNGGVHNDKSWCKRDERFKIEFLEGNHVRLRTLYEHQYLTCHEDGHMGLAYSPSSRSILKISINVEGDKVALYSPTNNRYVSARGSGKVTCDQSHNLADEQYRGWKRGPKNAWEARDEWQIVGAYDNRFSSGLGSFAYSKIVGVEITKERSVLTGARAPTDLVSLIGLRNYFSEHVHPTVKYEWSKTSSKTWTEATVISASIQVPPGKKVVLYQAVGFYGIFTIYSNYFQARDSVNETETFGQEFFAVT